VIAIVAVVSQWKLLEFTARKGCIEREVEFTTENAVLREHLKDL
jgi:hypothetical protein